jgi:archaellum biogenesis ATPase FlaH
MDLEKQRLVLSCLASNRDLMALCSGILKPSYFDPTLKKTVKFMMDYFEKYRDVPKIQAIRAEAGTVLDDAGAIGKSDVEYISTEVESFCQQRAMMEAIMQGPELVHKGDFNTITKLVKDALSVGLQKDLGLDYFADPKARLTRTLETAPAISTGIPELDAMIGGGLRRQELIVFAANSGVGKSMTMLNLCVNLLKQGYNGVYITLEMAEDVVSLRADSMFSKVARENLLKNIDQVSAAILEASATAGKFMVKRMPESRTTYKDIRAYVQQLERSAGFKPDFIAVDYIDIMGTTAQIQMDNVSAKDKFVTEEVRSLGLDFNCIMISASQLNRGAVEAASKGEATNQAHIAGGSYKINTSDYTIAIQQTDLMRASGEIVFEALKIRNRNSTAPSRALLGWDPVSLSIFSFEKKKNGLVLKKKGPVLGTEGTVFKKSPGDDAGILSLMNT